MIAAPRIRSTPLRLTIILISIFGVAALGCLAAAYAVTRVTIDATLKADLEQTIHNYRAIRGSDALLERLSEAIANTDPAVRILHYLPDQGPVLSNVSAVPPVSGFAVMPDRAIAAGQQHLADSYLALSARVGPGQLIVGQSREQVVEMTEIFLGVLLIGLLPALLIAGAFGWRIGQKARDRLETIEAALHRLTGGMLSARVSGIDGQLDDLSVIGHSVNRMAEAQEALVSSMRQISSDIAHDLKTPIQRVAVVLDQMLTKTTLTEGQDVLLHRAVDETDRITRTFQALLQLAQIEGGAVRDRLQPVDLAVIAQDMVDFLGVEAEDSGFTLTCDTSRPSPFIVIGNRELLTQLIANLVQNALTHVPTGGPVAINISQDQSGVILTVSDRGPGVAEHERENVLRRLYRLDASRTAPGNGLGLSLVAAIASLHDARLTLEDNKPGLRVRVIFPTAA